MKIAFNEFFGTVPKYDPEQINDGYAAVSTNTRPGRGILEPWRAPSAVAGGTLNNNLVKSLFKYNNVWFSWTNSNVSAVRVPIKNDPYDYTLIADPSTYPQITTNEIAESGIGPYPATTHRVGVPIPAAPTNLVVAPNPSWVEPSPAPTEDDYDIYETSYVLVYVDAWGRVGPMSDPSDRVAIREYQFENTNQVTMDLPTAVPSGFINTDAGRGTNAVIRVYRANYSSTGSGLYQYVGEVTVGTAQFVDTLPSGDLLDAVSTDDWIGPPDDDAALFPNGPMRNAIVVASSFIAGNNDKLVVFSEPETTHAFPPRYYQVFTEKLVTISPLGSNVAVLTDSFPYVLTGVHPENMSPVKLADSAPCVSELGVTEVNDAVYYASDVGMFMIRGFGLENVTKNYMTEREWRDLDPANMDFSNYDGRVFIHCKTPGYTLVFNPSDPADGLRRVDINPQASIQLEVSNDLAYVENGDAFISQFDSHATNYMAISYESKHYHVNEPVCFSCARVRANTFPVDVTFYMTKLDGSTASYTKTVTDDTFFYLDFQSLGRHYWCTVTSAGGTERPEIRSIQMAQNPSELEG